MRALPIVLAALLLLVQAELWFGRGGVSHVRELQRDVAALRVANDQTRARNERLQAEVTDLREGLEMVEEKARLELGMIRPDEMLVVVTSSGAH